MPRITSQPFPEKILCILCIDVNYPCKSRGGDAPLRLDLRAPPSRRLPLKGGVILPAARRLMHKPYITPPLRGSRRSRSRQAKADAVGGGRRAAIAAARAVEADSSRFVSLRVPSCPFVDGWSLVGWGGNPCHDSPEDSGSRPGCPARRCLQPDPGQPVGPPGSFLFVAAGRFDLGAASGTCRRTPPMRAAGSRPWRSARSRSGSSSSAALRMSSVSRSPMRETVLSEPESTPMRATKHEAVTSRPPARPRMHRVIPQPGARPVRYGPAGQALRQVVRRHRPSLSLFL